MLTRRDLLCRSGMGLGALGLTSLLASEGLLRAAQSNPSLGSSPLMPRRPHFAGRAIPRRRPEPGFSIR